MRICYLIPALCILSSATLGDKVAVQRGRHRRSVFDMIPQATTEDGEKKISKDIGRTSKGERHSGGNMMFTKLITKVMRKKIRKWFRSERENMSSLQFLKDMNVLSDKLETISKH